MAYGFDRYGYGSRNVLPAAHRTRFSGVTGIDGVFRISRKLIEMSFFFYCCKQRVVCTAKYMSCPTIAPIIAHHYPLATIHRASSSRRELRAVAAFVALSCTIREFHRVGPFVCCGSLHCLLRFVAAFVEARCGSSSRRLLRFVAAFIACRRGVRCGSSSRRLLRVIAAFIAARLRRVYCASSPRLLRVVAAFVAARCGSLSHHSLRLVAPFTVCRSAMFVTPRFCAVRRASLHRSLCAVVAPFDMFCCHTCHARGEETRVQT